MDKDKNASQTKIKDLLKYCLGYIKLINPASARLKLFTDPLDETIFNTSFMFDLNPAEETSLLINLKEFYEINPKDVTEEIEATWLKQKSLAVRLEEIKNKYKVDEFTKQITLNFGYFKVEIPEETEIEEELEEQPKKKKQGDHFPLFSIPVEIQLRDNKYYLNILDQNVIPNLGFLQDVLGEESYFDFADFVNQIEIEGSLALPLKNETVTKIWEELKGRLKLSDAQFDENSFDVSNVVVSLSSKSNYFLVQDLKKLTEMTEEEMSDTSLSSWVSDEDLSISDEISEDSGELFFPFDYDKHQLKVLSVINNKAAIVQGPPGTGKSQTIANVLCHLAAQGKRVLFLSQKPQALKVVKDKLKTLEVDYLYGYIPNRYSALYNQEEEKDGAAYTLAGVQQYVNWIHDRGSLEKDIETESVSVVSEIFNDSIDQQRTFYYLYNQLAALDKYDIKIPFPEKFTERFTVDEYRAIQYLNKELEELNNSCGKYSNGNKFLSKLNTKYNNLITPDKTFSEDIKELIEIVEKHGYDRRNQIGRFFNNTLLKFRHKGVTDKLPLEIYEAFEQVIDSGNSKFKMKEELNILREYFHYKECIFKIDKVREELDLKIFELGLDSHSLKKLEDLIAKEDIDNVINALKLKIDIENQIKILEVTNPNAVNKSLIKVRSDRKDKVKIYLRNRVKGQVIDATLTAITRGILARIAKALQKSKKAYRTFDTLKSDPSNFQTLKEVIPVWIMDLEDASRLIPLDKNMFDYIILDEASQCNLAYAMPSMYRSEHVLFFGDSEQMRDDSIKFKTNRSLEDLARKFHIPDYLQIKSKSDSVKSVLDIGVNSGFQEKILLYHYRSPKEIIGFSNENIYAPKRKKMEVINSNYLTYKETNKIMVNHVLKADRSEDISEKTNLSEAKYITKLVKQLQEDEKTKDKSIGVLTFFSEQAYLIKQMIEDENVKVSNIEGIQGDERDIIIYSFVISDSEGKRRYVPLTGEQGEINKGLNEGRVNVAFSRARLQVHCVTSMPIKEWPEGIWIRRYLEYVEENGEVDFYDQNIKKFDSFFEEEFYHFIRNRLGKKFIIQNQVESCGFKIDFVINNPSKGIKLAIECDGPTHFEDEGTDVYVISDLERQAILERAGWTFYRILYSDWISEDYDREVVFEDINNYFDQPSKFLSRFTYTQAKTKITLTPEVTSETEKEDIPQEVYDNQVGEDTVVKNPFNEVLRFPIDERRDLVASLIENGRSLWINEYLKTGSYIGFTNKGIGIGTSDFLNFLNSSRLAMNSNQAASVQWKGTGKSRILIRQVDNQIIDVRHYVESSRYTGFTKRGFRLPKQSYINFIDALETKLKTV